MEKRSGAIIWFVLLLGILKANHAPSAVSKVECCTLNFAECVDVL